MRWVGFSCAVPRRSVESTEAYARFPKQNVDRLISNIGVLRHREAEPGTTSADLCRHAAEPLIAKLGWEKSSIDALLFMTQSPDHLFPGTGYLLQKDLGLSDRCLVLDINQGCAGFTHGVILMNALINAGLVKRGLLLCGEVTTGTVRYGVCNVTREADLGSAILFGDAGSAALFEAGGEEQFKAGVWGSDGNGHQMISVRAGGFREFASPSSFELQKEEDGTEHRPIDLRINGAAMFILSIRRVPPLIEEVLAKASWTRDDVDSFVFYQGNKFILDFLRKKMAIPEEKMPLSIEEFGNVSSASIPLTILTRLGHLHRRRARLVLAGFGSGLSWSGVALETNEITSLPLIEL